MRPLTRSLIALAAFVALGTSTAIAQHSDVLLQRVNSRLVSGSADFDTGAWTLGARVYARGFDSDFAVNNPGWNALGTGSPDLPTGADPLPADTDLEWDFVPMKIGGVAQNLFYWDGMGTVDFGALPTAAYEVSIQSKSEGFIGTTSAPQVVVGSVIDDTDEIGSLHRHRFFFLDDDDGDLGTSPADGIYLFAVRNRIQGTDRSAPIYFVFDTLGATPTALDDASAWVDARTAELSPDYAADFDGNLAVDGRDFFTWLTNVGTTGDDALQIAGDATNSPSVNGTDRLAWNAAFGNHLGNFAGASLSASAMVVPEPGTALLVAVAFVIAIVNSRRVMTQIRRGGLPAIDRLQVRCVRG